MKKKTVTTLKKFLAVSFAIIIGVCSFACKKDGAEHVLDGKKIIFIGNSYTYYGQTVLEKKQSVLTQADRSNDKGYFYQLCKANGAEVNVTNWTFGGHSLEHLFGGSCSANRGCDGVDHASYLTDRNYDYVVMQPGSGVDADTNYLTEAKNIMNFFKAGNPNTKFVALVSYSCYGTIGSTLNKMENYLNNLKTLEAQGVTVVDWGGLIMDIMNKKVQVPNSTIEYTKNTFVVAKSAKDGYHPNLLSGYITTLMTYCAITGESAQGKTYDFCNDPALRLSTTTEFFNFTIYQGKYYTVGTTNFTEVFASQNDMQGIQGLIDAHLAAKAYMNYNY
ncbi:MAG: hypothetical protein IKA72_03845 [Clostridia bacterium]|nr:hypothetical protein [Clostridia bacterium]